MATLRSAARVDRYPSDGFSCEKGCFNPIEAVKPATDAVEVGF
jgi:hypothetical protein